RVNVYLGHARDDDRGPNGERQPPDFCGVFSGGYFDARDSSIRGRLRLVGPAAPMARAVAAAYLDAYASGEPAPDVGLSASLFIVADGRRVVEIAGVESLDVIATRPARGGRFEAALSRLEDQHMAQALRVALSGAPAVDVQTQQAATSPPAVAAATQATPLPTPAQQPAATANPSTTDLAQAVATAVAAALAPVQQEIASLRTGLAAQAAPAVVQNLGAPSDGGRRNGWVSVGQAPLDQLQLAVDHLFGVRLPQGAAFSRLRGIKDLYLFVTGDDEMRGIFQPERAQFANATSTTLNDLTKNALNKYCQQYFQDAYLWWEDVAQVVEFGTLQDPTWITMGGFGDLPTVAEGGTYAELTIADSAETSTWLKKGGFIGITLEAIDKDDTGKIAAIPRELASSAYRTLSAAVAAIFTQASGVGPTLADALALFHATHANLGTTALTSANWEAAIQAMYKQAQLNSARRLGVRPERLLVPIELEATALQIVGSDVMDSALQRNVRKGSARVVVCPEFTDANDWAALADPAKNPAIGVGFRFGRVPEVFSDPGGQRMFTNDQLDLKARFFFTIGVIDYRAVRKHNVV
ncbi:MAG: hypothetical protein QOH59_378, partial [Gemmatimonadales bacterium]|nr:hypothetical protein [Gemmatimonadales bacterium]